MNNTTDIDFFCPYCTQKLNGPADLAGQVVSCPVCNKRFQIPARKIPDRSINPTKLQNFPPFVTPLKDEKLVCEARLSHLYFLGSYLLGGLCLLVGIICIIAGVTTENGGILTIGLIAAIFGLPYTLWTTVNMLVCVHSYHYVLTNLRVLAKKGLLSITTSEVRISDIRGANLRQGILERMCDIGSIAIGSAATAGTEIFFIGIQNPRYILSLINAQRKS